RLAGAVDADHQDDLWPYRRRNRTIDGRKHIPDLVLDELAEARRPRGLLLHRGDDSRRRGDADVGRNQQLLERVERIDINRAGAAFRLVRLADNFVEALDDFLFGAGKTLADAAKEVHRELAN